MKLEERLQKTEELVGHTFSDKTLLLRAITHPSAAENAQVRDSYERLEFLGDSLVGALVAHWLFLTFPDYDEGELTRLKVSLVSGATLSRVSQNLGLQEIIVFGSSETGSDSRGIISALEDVYESLTAALFLDGGKDCVVAWFESTLLDYFKEGLDEIPENPKSALQELAQRELQETPVYECERVAGPDHNPTFSCIAILGEKTYGSGEGNSKKDAETEAALEALKKLEQEFEDKPSSRCMTDS